MISYNMRMFIYTVIISICLFVAIFFGFKIYNVFTQPPSKYPTISNTIEASSTPTTSTSDLTLMGQIQELKDENEYLKSQISAYKELADVANKNADEAMAQLQKLESQPPEKIYIYVTTDTVQPKGKGP